MTEPVEILNRRNEIKDCVAISDMENAIKRLIDFTRDFYMEFEDEVILISMEFYDLNEELRRDLVEYDTGKRHKRKIAFRVLETLKVIMTQLINDENKTLSN